MALQSISAIPLSGILEGIGGIEMRQLIPLFAVTLLAAVAARAQAQVPQNCLDYMSADAAFEKVAAPYRQAKASADKARREMVGLAKKRRNQDLRRARDRFRATARSVENGPEKGNLRVSKGTNEIIYRQAKARASEAYKRREADAKAALGEELKKREREVERTRRSYRKALRTAEKPNAPQSAKIASRNAKSAYNAALSAQRKGKRTASIKLRRAVRAARSEYNFAVRDARRDRDEADKSATRVYRERIDLKLKPMQAAYREAKKFAERRYRQSRSTADDAYTKSLREERKTYEKVRKAWEDAYLAAYENPGRGARRKASGYDRALVLKVAQFERRKFCPAMK